MPRNETFFCRSTVGFTVLLGALGVLFLTSYTAVAAEVLTGDSGAVGTLEDSIGLLKWIGGSIVTGLAAAVGLLYRALEKSNAQQRADLKEGAERLETLISRSVENSIELQRKIMDLGENIKELVVYHRERDLK